LYWRFDSVVSLKAVIHPVGSETPDSTIARQLLVPVVSQIVGESGEEWVSGKISDPNCSLGCDFTVDGVLLTLHVAENGARLLDVDQEGS
jgi:hypothetical protein